jgi:hypothetical protein
MNKSYAWKLMLAAVTQMFGAAVANAMVFSEHDPCGGGNSYSCRPFILAKGQIQADTAQQFRQFIQNRRDKSHATVFFDSSGGNLAGALALGRAIRQLSFDTYVGTRYVDVLTIPRNGKIDIQDRVLSQSPICASACAYAFLGGRLRTVGDGASILIHQFRSLHGDQGEQNAQAILSTVSRYVREMGVDLRLVELASATPNDRTQTIGKEQAISLAIDNSRRPEANWAISVQPNGHPILLTRHEVDPGRTLAIGFQRKGAYRLLFVGIFLSASVPLEVREAMQQAVHDKQLTLSFFVDQREVNLEADTEFALRTTTPDGLKLTPFHGHLTVTVEGVRSAQIKAAVPGGVSPADH